MDKDNSLGEFIVGTVEGDDMKDVKFCPQHGYPLPCHKCGMPLSKESEIFQAGYKQKEKDLNLQMVSLSDLLLKHRQAGRKEVVDWFLNSQGGATLDELNTKLKEWEVDG